MREIWIGLFGAAALIFLFGMIGTESAYGHPASQGIQSQSEKPASTETPGAAKSGNKRHCGGSRRRQVPKPERNRLNEGGSKKRNNPRRRKKHRRNAAACKKQKRRKPEPRISDDEIGKSRKNNEESNGLKIRTERIDDVPLLIEMMKKIGLPEIIDKHIPTQPNQRELSWGWTAVVWLAYILSEGDHRKVAVRGYIEEMQGTLSRMTGQKIDELDFTDDRLTNLLRYFSKTEAWNRIEEDLSSNSISVYKLPQKTARLDATTVSGYHEVEEGGLFQFGNSKDNPDLAQIKIMTGALDPLGMPLASDVVSGEKADDKLYAPIIERISRIIDKTGLLYVGDCKLCSFENRLFIKEKKGHYLCPLPLTGKTPEKMEEWIRDGVSKDEKDELIKIIVKNAKGEDELIEKGYEIEREHSGIVNDKELQWVERVVIVKGTAYAKRNEKGFEKRLKNAIDKIYALTPARARGKRQITDESELKEAVEKILKKHRVEAFLTYEYEKEVEKKTKYVGRGRGGANREKTTTERIRYQITNVARDEKKIKEEIKKFGWKAFVTDVSKKRLPFQDVIKCYRKEYRVERVFNRLKSRLNISPLHMKRKDQVIGGTHLLTVAVRIYTLIEFVVRRSLQQAKEKLSGLHPENFKKQTDTPTCERILKAFSKITLTIIESGGQILRHIPPLSPLQRKLLESLGMGASIYEDLEIKQSGLRVSE